MFQDSLLAGEGACALSNEGSNQVPLKTRHGVIEFICAMPGMTSMQFLFPAVAWRRLVWREYGLP
jgi:hypothetical protein